MLLLCLSNAPCSRPRQAALSKHSKCSASAGANAGANAPPNAEQVQVQEHPSRTQQSEEYRDIARQLTSSQNFTSTIRNWPIEGARLLVNVGVRLSRLDPAPCHRLVEFSGERVGFREHPCTGHNAIMAPSYCREPLY